MASIFSFDHRNRWWIISVNKMVNNFTKSDVRTQSQWLTLASIRYAMYTILYQIKWNECVWSNKWQNEIFHVYAWTKASFLFGFLIRLMWRMLTKGQTYIENHSAYALESNENKSKLSWMVERGKLKELHKAEWHIRRNEKKKEERRKKAMLNWIKSKYAQLKRKLTLLNEPKK